MSESSESLKSNDEFIQSAFDDLPFELKWKIFRYLDIDTLLKIRSVNKIWHEAIVSPKSFWDKIMFKVESESTLEDLKNLSFYISHLKFQTFALLSIFQNGQLLASRISNGQVDLLKSLNFTNLRVSQIDFFKIVEVCPILEELSFKKFKFLNRLQFNKNKFEEQFQKLISRISRNFKKIQIFELHFFDIKFLFENLLFCTKNLQVLEFHESDFDIREDFRLNGSIYDDEQNPISSEPSVESTVEFMTILKEVIIQNKYFEELKISFYYHDLTLIFFRRIIKELTKEDVQLKKFCIPLCATNDSSMMMNSLEDEFEFWESWEEFFIVDNPEATDIRKKDIVDIFVEFIKHQNRIEELRIPATREIVNDFTPFLQQIPTTLKQLEYIHLFSEINMENSLKKVSAYFDPRVTPSTLEHISDDVAFPTLEEITLEIYNPLSQDLTSLLAIFDAWQDGIKRLPPNLRVLKIFNTIEMYCSSDRVLQLIISSFPHLEELVLNDRGDYTDAGISGVDKDWIKRFIHSHSETFATWIEENNAKKSNDNKNINETQQIVPINGPSLSLCPNLRVLHIKSMYRFTDIGIYFGLSLPKLKSLILLSNKEFSRSHQYNKVSDWGLIQLAKNCPNLEAVEINLGCSTTYGGAKKFIESLPRLKPAKCAIHRKAIDNFMPNRNSIACKGQQLSQNLNYYSNLPNSSEEDLH